MDSPIHHIKTKEESLLITQRYNAKSAKSMVIVLLNASGGQGNLSQIQESHNSSGPSQTPFRLVQLNFGQFIAYSSVGESGASDAGAIFLLFSSYIIYL